MKASSRATYTCAKILALVVMVSFVVAFSGGRRVFAANIWTEQTDSPTGWWRTIRSSADGRDLIGDLHDVEGDGDQLYLSRDGGTTWTDISPDADPHSWTDVGISQDGSTVVAVDNNDGGYIWEGFVTYSPNFYVNWRSQTGDGDTAPGGDNWSSVAVGNNGSYIAASEQNDGAIWVTEDNENTWQRVDPYSGTWSNIAFSPDGGTFAAANDGGHIIVSQDGGADWTATSTQSSAEWDSVAVSDNGDIVASRVGEPILFGSGYGTTWTNTEFDGAHIDRVAISEDGVRMAATQNGGYIATADTSDITNWTLQSGDGTPDDGAWYGVALNSDGTRLNVGSYGQHTWLLTQPFDMTPPVITILGANPVSINVDGAYVDAGATASDNVDGDLTSSIVTTSSVNTHVPGTYTVTYAVSDAANNAATSTRSVIVRAQQSSGGGGSITQQVHTLESMGQGENKVAQALIQEFPSLFPGAAAANSSSSVGSAVATSTLGASKIKVTQLYKSRNNSVKIIQQLLGADSSLNYTGGVTGYFGRATQAAVEAFQVAHSIVKPERAGYGSVGPKTRLAMIEAYGE
jgi:hypothetical protein